LSASTAHPPVFCAVVDRAYFLGAVALVNSLRLTGHTGEIAFLDVGLEPDQREFLEQEATIHEGPPDVGWLSVFVKPKLGLLFPDRTAVILDNDLVITGSLEPLVHEAEKGAIAVFEQPDPTRWFAEWQDLFSLGQPLRPGKYVNGACVVLSTTRWRGFLERWHDLGEVVAGARAGKPFVLRPDEVVSDPVGYNEQDTLNALLMSEVPESAVSLWSHELTPWWDDRNKVRLVDSHSLRCEMDGRSPFFLHSTGVPKPWQRGGWLRSRYLAFNRLLTRSLVGEDVPLRLRADEIPRWLRPSIGGRLLESSGASVAGITRYSAALLPDAARARLMSPVRARISGTTARR
jgi:hypothetical protein